MIQKNTGKKISHNNIRKPDVEPLLAKPVSHSEKNELQLFSFFLFFFLNVRTRHFAMNLDRAKGGNA